MLEDFRAVVNTLDQKKGQLNVLQSLLDPLCGVEEWRLSPGYLALLQPYLVTLDSGDDDTKVFLNSPMYSLLLAVGEEGGVLDASCPPRP
jgi:hypothetical protein